MSSVRNPLINKKRKAKMKKGKKKRKDEHYINIHIEYIQLYDGTAQRLVV